MENIFDILDRFYESMSQRFRNTINSYRSMTINEEFLTNKLSAILSLTLKIAVPMIGFSLCLIIIFSTSVSIFFLVKGTILPHSLVNEQIYFDYSKVPPIAQLNFRQNNRQWDYINGQCRLDEKCVKSQPFLKSGYYYDIKISFQIARTDQQMNDVLMSKITLFDSTSAAVAKSLRPVLIPYRSSISRFLDGFMLYPFRLFGFQKALEMEDITILAMSNYFEAAYPHPSTELIEVELIGNHTMVHKAFVNILPELKGFSYFLTHFPLMSASMFIGVLSILQAGMVSFAIMTYYLVSSVTQENESN